jgi:hypothetical protein
VKKLLLLIATAAGAVLVRNKMAQDASDTKLWAEATKDDTATS